MGSFISETSNYLFVITILLFLLSDVLVFNNSFNKSVKDIINLSQVILGIFLHAIGYITLLIRSDDIRYFFFFAFQEIIILAVIMIYHTLYPKINKTLLYNMFFFLFVGSIMLSRLKFDLALKQFIYELVILVFSFFVPYIIKRIPSLDKWYFIYAGVGVSLLLIVVLAGRVVNGSMLAFRIGDMSFQSAEFVKISLVLFLASYLANYKKAQNYIFAIVIALIHIAILVVSRDLGSAGIYFMSMIFLIFVSSENILTILTGAIAGLGSFTLAYIMFDHVKVRVATWLNPWEDIRGSGYQLTQSLFAIGTGGWFGLGLLKGMPYSIPYVSEDFIFSAIGEEMGVFFSCSLIFLYLAVILYMFKLAKSMKNDFYKYTIYGFGVSLATQVVLTVGGGSRFIPLTGVTLPLISMGGSSLWTTILMFSIIQGMVLANEAEEPVEEEEEEDEI